MATITDIDIGGLRDALACAENMVRHYGDISKKEQQNAALATAGLAPLHAEYALNWDREQSERHQRQANALRATIALLEGEPVEEAA